MDNLLSLLANAASIDAATRDAARVELAKMAPQLAADKIRMSAEVLELRKRLSGKLIPDLPTGGETDLAAIETHRAAARVILEDLEGGKVDAMKALAVAVCYAEDAYRATKAYMPDGDSARHALGMAFLRSMAGMPI